MMQDFSNIFSTISPMLKTLFSKLPQKCLIYNKSLSKTKYYLRIKYLLIKKMKDDCISQVAQDSPGLCLLAW